MSNTDFKSTPLFGGAIIADLPSTFQDVSSIRQVPDNQEVYLDSQGFSSIVFDILERVEKGSDEEAVRFHLEDIVEDEKEVKVVEDVAAVSLEKMPGTKAYILTATSPPGEKMRGRPNEPEIVGLLLLVVRLEGQGTDLVVAVNVPCLPGEEGERIMGVGGLVRERVRESFEVVEWGLFGE